MAKTKTLKGGSFNLLFGRDHKTVQAEVIALLTKHNLDFLVMQEAENYNKVLSSITGYKLISDPTTWSGQESVILVKDIYKTDRVKFFTYGDGWFTLKKRHHPESGQSKTRVDGWLIVRALHLPTPSFWDKDGPTEKTPANRKDDLIASVQALADWFSAPCIKNARVAVGDWNEAPTTTGLYSPGWLQETTGAVAVAPEAKLGHGHIDYAMSKGADIVDTWKDIWISEASDHEPVIFVLTKVGAVEMLKRNARLLRNKRKKK